MDGGMNREDIIRMAREAGFYIDQDWIDHGLPGFERFAAIVAAAEREAVLDLVEDYAKGNTDLRDAIRARGN